MKLPPPRNPLEEVVYGSQRLAPGSQELYYHRVRDFCDFAGHTPDRWTPMAVEGWRNHNAARGLDPSTVNLYLTAIKYASRRYSRLTRTYDFAEPAESIRIISEKHPKEHALTVEDVRRLLSTCSQRLPRDLRDRALILVAIHTGLRRQELVMINFEDVEPKAQRIVVIAKRNRRHVVPVQGEAWSALQDWMNWLRARRIAKGRVFRGLRPSIDGGFVIGDSITPDAIYKMLKSRANRGRLTANVHPHGLRHTFVWLALSSGVEPWRVQLMLGHKSQAMTMHYASDLNETGVGAAFPSLDV